MASADFLCDIPSPHGVGSRSITQDLPEYDALLSRFTCRIYIVALRTCIWTLSLVALLSSNDASYPLPVRQASVLLSASFRPLVTKTPLPSRYSLPHVGLERWTYTTSSAPCRAHHKKAVFPNKENRFRFGFDSLTKRNVVLLLRVARFDVKRDLTIDDGLQVFKRLALVFQEHVDHGLAGDDRKLFRFTIVTPFTHDLAHDLITDGQRRTDLASTATDGARFTKHVR